MTKRLLVLFVILYCSLNYVVAAGSGIVNSYYADDIETSGPTTFCQGESVDLSIPLVAGDIYIWFKNDDPIDGETQNIYHATSSGSYSLKVTHADLTEETYDPVIVKVLNPQASFTSNAVLNQCSDQEVTFTNTSTDALTYEWDFGDGTTSTAVNPKHTFIGTPGGGTQDFTVKLTVKNGSCTDVISQIITTRKTPDLIINDANIFSPFSNCSNNPSIADPNYTITIENNSPNPAHISTYSIDWDDGTVQAGLTQASFPISHTYTTLGAFDMVITANGVNGCSTTKTYTIANQSNPAGGLGTLGNTAGLCAPANVPFVISNWQNNSPGTTYELSYGDGITETFQHPLNLTNEDQTVYHTYNTSSCPAASFTAILVVKNACSATPYTAGNIQIWTGPVADFTSSINTICVGNAVSFNNTTVRGSYGPTCSDAANFNWDFGDPGSPDNISTLENPSHVFNTPGSYTITLTASSPCGTTTKTYTICVNPLPTADFTLDKEEGCGPLDVQITNLSNTPTCGTNSYSWVVTYANFPGCVPGTSDYNFLGGPASAASENPKIQFINPGIYTLQLTTKNSDGTCSATSTKTITVKSPPTVTLGSIPGTICAGSSIAPSATVTDCGSSTPSTYVWSFPGSNTPSSVAADPGSIIYPDPGTYTITLAVTNGCGTTIKTQQITVTETPVINAQNDLTYCNAQNVPAIVFGNATDNNAVSYSWANDNPGVGLGANGTGSIPAFTAQNLTSSPITATITVKPTLDACPGLPISFTITVNPSAPVANAGNDVVLCNQSSFTLDGNDPAPATGIWTLTSGPSAVTFDDPTKYNATVSGLQPGEYIFKWTINAISPCTGSEDEVTITVSPASVGGITSGAATVCAGTNSGIISLSGQTGDIIRWQSSTNEVNWTDITYSAANYTFNNLSVTTFFRAIVKSGPSCPEAESTATKITVSPTAPIASAGNDVVLCNQSSFTLDGNDPETATGIWTLTSGPSAVTFDDPTKYNATVSGLQPGEYIFKWTINAISPCTGSEDEVTITVSPASVGGTTSGAVTVCAGTNSGIISLSGQTGDIIRWQSSTNEVNWTDIPYSAADYTFNNLSVTTFFRAVVKSGPSCPEAESTATKITVSPTAPIANAGNDVVLCNQSSFTLDGNDPETATGIWTLTSGPSAVTFDDPTKYNATVSGLQPGEYIFKWTINAISPCTGSENEVTITVSPASNGGTTNSDQAFCGGTNSGTINLTGNVGDVLRWERSTDNGGSWSSIPSTIGLTSYNFTVSTTTLFRVVVQSGACPIAYSSLTTITVIPLPVVTFSVPDQTICNGTPTTEVSLNSSVSGVTFAWTATPSAPISGLTTSGTDKILSQSLINTTNTPITITYLARATTTGSTTCPGQDATYKIVVNPTPNVTPSVTAQTICSNTATSIDLSSTVPGTAFSWAVTTDPGITGAANGSGTTIAQTLINTGTAPASVTYTITPAYPNTPDPCNGAPATVIVTVNPAPKVSTVSADQYICNNGAIAPVTFTSTTTGANISWNAIVPAGITGITATSGTSLIPAENNIQNTTNAPLTIVYQASATTNDALACQGEMFEYRVTVNPEPRVTNVVLEQNVCSGIGSAVIALSSNVTGATFSWTASSPDITGFPASGTGNIPSIIYNNSGTEKGIVTYKITASANGCEGPVTLFVVTVNPVPAFTGNASPTAICSNTLFNYTPASTSSEVLFSWTRAAVAGISNPAASGSGIDNAGSISETLINTTINPVDVTYIYTLSIDGCSNPVNFPVVLTVNPSPTAYFGPFDQNGCAPFDIRIKNLNSKTFPNTYSVDFGDGTPVATYNDEQDITHTYENETIASKTFTLKITTTNACGSTPSIDYTIIVQPQSVFSKLVLQGDQRYGCAPFTVDFSTLNQSTGANAFTWDFGDGSPVQQTSSVNEPLTHTFTQAGDFTIKLTASNGCSTVSSTQQITIHPEITASFSTDKLQYCVEEAIIFNNTSSVQVAALWDFGDGTTSTDLNPSHAYATSGNKLARLTTIQVFPDGTSCSATVEHEITVLPPPIASFNSNAGLLNCAPFNLTVTSTPANAANVEWDFGDPDSTGNIATGYNASHLYTNPGTYLVKATAYSLQGCMAESTQTIIITETPKPAFTFPDTLICGPAATIFFKNTSVYNGADAVTYKWYINNELVPAPSDDLNYTFNTPANVLLPYVYNIRLEATNIVGCSNSITHTVQFNPLPQADFSFVDDKGCAPFNLQITNKSLFADKYVWYIDGVLVSEAETPANILLPDPDKSYSIKLVADNKWGCTTSEITKQAGTYPKPTALFTVKEDLSCNGKLELEITNESTGATTYNWDFGDGSAEYTGTAPAHIYGSPGIYILKLTASNGFCSEDYTKTIRIAAPPKAAFLSDVKTGCNQVTVTFQNISDNASTYLWDFGDGTFSTDKHPVHTYNYVKSPFTVHLTATGDFGCSDEAVMVNFITVTAPPVADIIISPAKTIKVPEYTFSFNAKSDDDIVSYTWDFGDGKTAETAAVEHVYTDSGTYAIKLTITNSAGCTSILNDVVTIKGVPGYLYIPNAFEPASDKPAIKTFRVTGAGMSSYTLKIFNKWGQVIWQSTKLDEDGAPVESWDGTVMGQPAQQGAYYWEARAQFINGTEWKGMKFEGKGISRTGVVHVIR